jgi:hypothetical protein
MALGSVAGNGGAAVKDRWKRRDPRRSGRREARGSGFVNHRDLLQVVTSFDTGLQRKSPDPAQTVNPKRVFAL